MVVGSYRRDLEARHKAKMGVDEELRLIVDAQSGCAAALERLVETCYGMVLSMVGKYGHVNDSDDLIAAGCEEIVSSVFKFDAGRADPPRFSTYVYLRLKGKILRCKHDSVAPVKVPYVYRDLLNAAREGEDIEVLRSSLRVTSSRVDAVVAASQSGGPVKDSDLCVDDFGGPGLDVLLCEFLESSDDLDAVLWVRSMFGVCGYDAGDVSGVLGDDVEVRGRGLLAGFVSLVRCGAV